jgi:hypothetical protein
MKESEVLKAGRDLLLSLHKTLVDAEREKYENFHGKLTSGQFLNLLLEDPEFGWLRKFSTLIVDIDEMFAQKDGFTEEAVGVHMVKLRELVLMENVDEEFASRYQNALQMHLDAASKQGELRQLLE